MYFKNNILLSDIKNLLRFLTKKPYNLFISDPQNYMVSDCRKHIIKEKSNKIWVNVSDEDITLSSYYDFIVDLTHQKIDHTNFDKNTYYLKKDKKTGIIILYPTGIGHSFYSKEIINVMNINYFKRLLYVCFYSLGFSSIFSDRKITIYVPSSSRWAKRISHPDQKNYVAIYNPLASITHQIVMVRKKKNVESLWSIISEGKNRMVRMSALAKKFNQLKIKYFCSNDQNKDDGLQPKNINLYYAPLQFNCIHSKAISALYHKTAQQEQIKDSQFWKITLQHLTLIQKQLFLPKKKEISYAVNLLILSLDYSKYIYTVPSYFDYTPWNVHQRNGEIYISEWKRNHFNLPLLFELYNYYFYSGIIRNKNISFTMNKIFKKLNTPCLHSIVQEFHIHPYENLKLFLLYHINHFFYYLENKLASDVDLKINIEYWIQAVHYILKEQQILKHRVPKSTVNQTNTHPALENTEKVPLLLYHILG